MSYIIENENMCVINKEAKIGDNTVIRIGSVIDEGVVIGNNCTIGPYAHIHTHSEIGDNCIIGNFVEIKKSKLGNNCKVKHLVYIGDCECGNNVNFGCGVVVANYNGREKRNTVIGNNVFIGCNSNLISPLKIGNNSYIAAGVIVNEDVYDNEFICNKNKKNIEHRPNKFC